MEFFHFIAKSIKFFGDFFFGDTLDIGLSLLSAGIGLLMFTTTTTIFFGLITRTVTPYAPIGFFLLGLSSIFISWGLFVG